MKVVGLSWKLFVAQLWCQIYNSKQRFYRNSGKLWAGNFPGNLFWDFLEGISYDESWVRSPNTMTPWWWCESKNPIKRRQEKPCSCCLINTCRNALHILFYSMERNCHRHQILINIFRTLNKFYNRSNVED